MCVDHGAVLKETARASRRQIGHESILVVFIIIIRYIHTVHMCPPVLTCILESTFPHGFLYLGIFSQYLLVLPCILFTKKRNCDTDVFLCP